jgi:cation diffusion facilitator family transporter
MFQSALNWLGFGHGDFAHSHAGHGHSHGDGEGHGHTHGVIDPTIATTSRGIWAIKWSFVMLMSTAIAQIVIVYYSGSVALLADTIHNIGDAVTAIPLGIAFLLARRKPSLRFTYGLGRAEDIAGVVIVGLILFSAIVAGWQAIDRLLNPQPIAYIGWVAAAGIIGFLGNEIVAVFRIRVGREIDSAALVADGYHARVDGFTSLAVVVGAIGVWLGFPLADPIIGLVITVMIFGIVWQSARAVFTRMLDGTEPGIPDEVHHAAEHVAGINDVGEVRARWIGHRLAVEVEAIVDGSRTVREADEIAAKLERELAGHLPALGRAVVRIRSSSGSMATPVGLASVGSAAMSGPEEEGRKQSGHKHDHGHGGHKHDAHGDRKHGDHKHGDHGHGGHRHPHDHDHPHKDHDHPHPHDHDHPHKDHGHPHPHGDEGKEHGHDHPHPHPHQGGHRHGHAHAGHGHHHAPEPVFVRGKLGAGELEIVDTPAGERFRFTPAAASAFDEAMVAIQRGAGTEELLALRKLAGGEYQSDRAPSEPHEFDAKLTLRRGTETEALPFKMVEPDHHH